MKPIITIITPCFNSEKYILQTAHSVLNQGCILNGRVELQYIVCDGSSKDNTLNLLKNLKSPHLEIHSESDAGMYDALAKGFGRARGAIVAYINAGDLYMPNAFDVVLDALENPSVQWLTGINSWLNERAQITSVRLPWRYRRSLISRGVYGRWLPFIQQESTFWRAELLRGLNIQEFSALRVAGDYYLWRHFAKTSDLYVINSTLAGFRRHAGQLSEDLSKYFKEVRTFTDSPGLADRCLALYDRVAWEFPARLKKRLNPKYLLVYDEVREVWS